MSGFATIGLTWAMQVPSFKEPHFFAVTGKRMLYLDPNGRWRGLPCEDIEQVCNMAVQRTAALEGMGGVLTVGPMEFVVPLDGEHLADTDVGYAAKKALGLW